MASRFWVGGTGTWATSGTTHWAATSGGSGGATVPTAADDVFIDSHSGGGTITHTGGNCRSLDFSTAPVTTLALAATTLTVGDASGGAITHNANVTITATTGAISLLASSTNSGNGWLITSNGGSFPKLNCGNASGKWKLADALTITNDVAFAFNVGSGSFVSNGKTITATRVSVAGGTADFSGSTVNLTATTATANAWDWTGGTLTAPSVIAITTASATGRTFGGGGKTYNTLTYTVAGSTGSLTITGANTFSAINFSDVTNARTLTLPASTTTTCTTFNVQGTASKLMTVNSSTSNTAATLSVASGNVQCDYLSLKDSAATGGATFYAGSHSTNVSGNTGWTFASLITGTASAPLGGLTATVSGTPSVSATVSAPLGALSASATGKPTVNATVSAPLGVLTSTTAGTPTVRGTLNAALGGLTATLSGTPSVAGTANAALGSLTASIGGTPTVAGAVNAPLGALLATTTGSVGVPGAVTVVLGALDASVSGAVTANATVTASLGPLTATIAGTVNTPAVVTAPLGGLDAHAVGTVTSPSTAKPAGGGGGGWQSPPMQPTQSRLVKADATFTLTVRFSVQIEQDYVGDPDEELALL